MRTLLLILLLIPFINVGQIKSKSDRSLLPVSSYVKPVDNLTLEAAFELTKRVNESAATFGKQVSIAILDASGTIILLVRGNDVGPHNTEAARRKAYTSLSTKTATLELLRNAEMNSDSKNLNSLPELLLLSGGSPIWYKGSVIGSIGVAAGGSAENDDFIAKSAQILELGITTIQ